MRGGPAARYDDFDRLVCRYDKLIRWLCWMYTGGNEAQTADLVQDVLLCLWNRRGTLRPGATQWQERAWVRLQCLSVLQHHSRKRGVETVPLPPEGIEALPMADSGDDTAQERERLYALADGLTAHERRLLDLLLENYSVAEIAKIMGIRPKSVSQLKMRMLEKMKRNSERKSI